MLLPPVPDLVRFFPPGAVRGRVGAAGGTGAVSGCPLSREGAESLQRLPDFHPLLKAIPTFHPPLCNAGGWEEEEGGRKAPAGRCIGAGDGDAAVAGPSAPRARSSWSCWDSTPWGGILIPRQSRFPSPPAPSTAPGLAGSCAVRISRCGFWDAHIWVCFGGEHLGVFLGLYIFKLLESFSLPPQRRCCGSAARHTLV